MEVLLTGAGVIGTVYGAQLAAAGHLVSVLAHGPRAGAVARAGLVAVEVITGTRTAAPVRVVEGADGTRYDLVLIAVRADQIGSVAAPLRGLPGGPALLFFGNNPAGRSALPDDLPGPAHLGFPGVGGSMVGGVAEYVRISQQPTTLEAGGPPAVAEFGAAMSGRGFPVTRTADMDGWLAYHAVFVGSVAAALYRCQGSAAVLAADRPTLTLMCRSIEEGFAALARRGVSGLPGNLRMLHRPALRPVAVRYWARAMRSPLGDLCFAAHSRHAETEMRALAADAVSRAGDAAATAHLRELLV
jgi:2-dehydropantoate 2-reductase